MSLALDLTIVESIFHRKPLITLWQTCNRVFWSSKLSSHHRDWVASSIMYVLNSLLVSRLHFISSPPSWESSLSAEYIQCAKLVFLGLFKNTGTTTFPILYWFRSSCLPSLWYLKEKDSGIKQQFGHSRPLLQNQVTESLCDFSRRVAIIFLDLFQQEICRENQNIKNGTFTALTICSTFICKLLRLPLQP